MHEECICMLCTLIENPGLRLCRLWMQSQITGLLLSTLFSTILWHAVPNNGIFSLRFENETSNLHYKHFVSVPPLSHTPSSPRALISSVSFLGSHMNPVISLCVREINYLVRLNHPVDALLCYCMNCICMYDNLLWRLHFPLSLYLSVITEISSSMPSRAIRRHYCMSIPRCKTLYDSKWNVFLGPLGLSYVSIWQRACRRCFEGRNWRDGGNHVSTPPFRFVTASLRFLLMQESTLATMLHGI